MKRKRIYGWIYVIILLLFMYLPILVMALFSFNDAKVNVWNGFSLRWYQQLFSSSSAVWEPLQVTLLTALFATAFSTVFGTLAALGIHDLSNKTKTAVLAANNLPVINPDIVTGVAMMLLFGVLGIRNGYLKLFLAHAAFCTPYVILAVLPKLKQMDPHLYESALDLGATPMYAVRKVVMPQIRSGIITGGLLAFTLSLDDFAVSYFVGGKVNNLSMYIYSATKNPTFAINAVSVLMFLAVAVLLLIINKRSDVTEFY